MQFHLPFGSFPIYITQCSSSQKNPHESTGDQKLPTTFLSLPHKPGIFQIKFVTKKIGKTKSEAITLSVAPPRSFKSVRLTFPNIKPRFYPTWHIDELILSSWLQKYMHKFFLAHPHVSLSFPSSCFFPFSHMHKQSRRHMRQVNTESYRQKKQMFSNFFFTKL